jgi:DNA mismatch repair protein MutL
LSLLEEVAEEKTEKKREKILATLACRTAVKAGEPLPKEKMDFLVEELFRTSNPGVCPHGRPVIVRLDKNQIEKGLKRSSG